MKNLQNARVYREPSTTVAGSRGAVDREIPSNHIEAEVTFPYVPTM